ncbi:MAG: TIGR00730 family Rossman fold protein [Nitrospinota bacterium]|nr:MAG: TIGR00730 family Rossman fold protein [Nitrospinota bacterium]
MALTTSTDNNTVDDQIMHLIHTYGESSDADLVKEIIFTALRLVGDRADRGDLKILNTALKELRYAFKVFKPYRNYRKVSIFGSARTQPDDPVYQQAVEFGRRVVERGYMVITGAGEGIMKAGQDGAGRRMSFGLNIRLPFEQVANSIIADDPKLITFKYFFTRKLIFVKETDAFAMFPGGFGTHDEAFEALTLLQTGKSDPMPVVFIDSPQERYWRTWEAFIQEHLVQKGRISPDDLSLFKITEDVEEAVEEIDTFYRNYHSLRYVKDLLVIRVNHSISPELLDTLNHDFTDLLAAGKIEASGALPEESNEPEIAHLPRLVLRFNRRNFGRLRQMIDVINRY